MESHLQSRYVGGRHFNREYSRFFGKPPMRDVRALRYPVAPKLELVGSPRVSVRRLHLWPVACALGLSEYHPVCSERIVGQPEATQKLAAVSKLRGKKLSKAHVKAIKTGLARRAKEKAAGKS